MVEAVATAQAKARAKITDTTANSFNILSATPLPLHPEMAKKDDVNTGAIIGSVIIASTLAAAVSFFLMKKK